MSPATHPPELRELIRLLLVDEARSEVRDSAFGELVQILRPGDLLVVNDAATLPAALRGQVHVDGEAHAIELRLLGPRASDEDPSGNHGHEQDRRWRAVLFGAGDWRTDTDERPAPPLLEPGMIIGLLTGMHGPSESHYRLLRAFAPQALLERAWTLALELGYHSHEFGDLALLLPADSRSDRRTSLGPEASRTSRSSEVRPAAPVGDP